MDGTSHPGWADTVSGADAGTSLSVRAAALPPDSSLGTPASSADGSTVLLPASGSGTAATLLAGGSGRLRLATGGYEAGSVLGVGGMGAVMLARQEELGREVAIKVLRPDLADPERRRLFAAESAIAARLSHPGIVPVHDATDGALVMRRVRGTAWSDALSAGAVPRDRLAAEAARLARVADALAYAHAQGVVHRDLKPANIMVGDDGAVLVLDWGLALAGQVVDGRWRCPRLVEDPILACAGTPVWIAPEAARCDADGVGPATDVFGLGAILHRLLAGRPPWAAAGPHGALAAAAVGMAPALPADAPPALAALRDRCMDEDPRRRPDAVAVAAALRAWIRQADQERRALFLVAGLDHASVAEAVARAADALELAPHLPAVAAAAAGAARRQAEAALAADDLLTAAAAAARLGAAGNDLAAAVARRQWQRAGARRRVRLWGAGAAALALLAAGGVAWIAADRAGQADRDRAARSAQAAAVVAAAPVDDRGRLLAALQAHGLDPDAPAPRALAAAAAGALADAALAAGDGDLAAHHGATARRFGGDDRAVALAAWRTAASAAAVRERARRTARLADLVGPARGGTGEDWRERAAAEVAGWPGDLGGIGLDALAEGDPLQRQLLARILVLRPGAAPSAVPRLLADATLPPALAAELAGAVGDPWPLLRRLNPWSARALVRRRPVPPPAADDTASAWIRGDGAALERVLAPGDARGLLAATALRWWHHQDAEGALALARRAAAIDAAAAAPWVAEGEHLTGAVPTVDDTPALAPWRALALVAAGDAPGALAHLRAASAACAAPWRWHWARAAEAAGDPALALVLAPTADPAWREGIIVLQDLEVPLTVAAADQCERHGPIPYVMALGAGARLAAGFPASAAILAAAARRADPRALRPLWIEALIAARGGATGAAMATAEDLGRRAGALTADRLHREGWHTAGDARREFLDGALALVPERDGAGVERLGTARLAADGGRATVHGAVVRARVIAARLARGDHEGAATLAAEQRPGGDAACRAGLDAVLFAVPALRRTGWPGCHGRTLALRGARAALGAAAQGRDPEPWLAPIALHGAAGALPALARAVAAGDRDAGAAALAALPGDLPLEPWLAEALPRCRRWAAGGPPPDLAPPPRDLLRPGPAVRTLVARWNARGTEWGRFAPVPGEGGDDGRVAAALGSAP